MIPTNQLDSAETPVVSADPAKSMKESRSIADERDTSPSKHDDDANKRGGRPRLVKGLSARLRQGMEKRSSSRRLVTEPETEAAPISRRASMGTTKITSSRRLVLESRRKSLSSMGTEAPTKMARPGLVKGGMSERSFRVTSTIQTRANFRDEDGIGIGQGSSSRPNFFQHAIQHATEEYEGILDDFDDSTRGETKPGNVGNSLLLGAEESYEDIIADLDDSATLYEAPGP